MLQYLEITTQVGCPVGCLKYCPQEIIIKRYGKTNLTLTFETFKQILTNTPKNVKIYFSGFCEPYTNPQCTKYIKYADQEGYKVALNTTLMGASERDILAIKDISFYHVSLHLPDGDAMKEPQSKGYREAVFAFITSIPNIIFISMNNQFKTNLRENVTRGILPKKRRYSYCERFREYFDPIVMPNGDVYLCCMDFGLNHCIGNLLKTSYNEIMKNALAKEGKYRLCHYCSANESIWIHYVRQVYRAFGKFFPTLRKGRNITVIE
jgi:hypothetical protein